MLIKKGHNFAVTCLSDEEKIKVSLFFYKKDKYAITKPQHVRLINYEPSLIEISVR